MIYTYEFDETNTGDAPFTRSNFETVQQALRMLRYELVTWNKRALEHGALSQPYEREVRDLNRMIAWGDDELSKGLPRVLVRGISVGSRRYQKAALLLMADKLHRQREGQARLGWPSAALRSLDGGIDRVGQLASSIEYEPSEVLREVIQSHGEGLPAAAAGADWDVFVSHASEDKEDFVRPLAKKLRALGLRVWFDEFTLTVGDNLRRSIDRGLARSRFGVVVISRAFLQKEWTQKELDGLVARESRGDKVVLPVWHGITSEEIRAYSPIFANRLAANSDKGIDHVVGELDRAVRQSIVESHAINRLVRRAD